MLAHARNWWVPALRGMAAVLFGIMAIVWPGLALATMVLMFGVFALFDGIVSLGGLFGARNKETPWWLQLLVGLTGIGAGILTFTYPGLTGVTLLTFIASYACVVGVSHVVSAIQQRDQVGAVGMGFSGAALGLFGLVMLMRPAVGVLTVAWAIGVFAIASGVGSLVLAAALYRAKLAGPRLTSTMMPSTREKVSRKP